MNINTADNLLAEVWILYEYLTHYHTALNKLNNTNTSTLRTGSQIPL